SPPNASPKERGDALKLKSVRFPLSFGEGRGEANNKILKQHVAILGSTGSIGKQALEVISANKDHFEVEVLTSYNNADLLIQQGKEFLPNAVVIGDEKKYGQVKEA